MAQQVPVRNEVVYLMGRRLQIRESKILDILLRLPPLFLMDQILLYDMGLNFFVDTSTEGESGKSKNPLGSTMHFTSSPSSVPHQNNTTTESSFNWSNMTNDKLEEAYENLYGTVVDYVALPHFLYFLGCFYTYMVAMIVITLNTRQLVAFYAYLVAFMCAPVSYWANNYTVPLISQVLDEVEMPAVVAVENVFPFSLLSELIGPNLVAMIQLFAANFVIQSTLGLVLTYVLRQHLNNNQQRYQSEWMFDQILSLSVQVPGALAIVGISPNILQTFTLISAGPALITAGFIVSKVIGLAIGSLLRSFEMKRRVIADYGLNTFLEGEWLRLRVPSLLRTFWITRFSQQLIVILFSLMQDCGLEEASPNMPHSDAAARITLNYMMDISRDLVTRGAETIIAVLGMTSIISTMCHYVGALFHMLLSSGSENEEEKSVASVSAILFFILALQTGLTSLEPDKRFSRLCKNLCLLVTALFHFIHNSVSPVLMSLSAGNMQANESRRHVRALSICLFLVIAPLTLMFCLWQWFTVGTWLLAVSAFCIEVVVKVVVTVSVYGLFLYDARARGGTWEGLDDAVYYVKAAGNSVEFCFAVFLFFNGGWILFFESGGTIRATMMLIHAYFNIWCEAKSGWKIFMKRRTAVAKINSLPDATQDELRTKDDVCAICYMDMSQAKVTQCKHYFHGVCLRKWLYMQDTCPLCHSVLYMQNQANDNANADMQVRAEDEGGDDDEEEVVDHDNAPYQAYTPRQDSSDSDGSSSDDDGANNSLPSSTNLSLSGSEYDEDDIIYDPEPLDIPPGSNLPAQRVLQQQPQQEQNDTDNNDEPSAEGDIQDDTTDSSEASSSLCDIDR